jgi:putative multiple sugar transport system substrate-binding protein
MNRFGKALLLASAAAFLLGTGLSAQKTVGIAMPTQSSQRWIADGGNMKKILEARGYKVDLQFAEDDIPAQVAQVENMITKGDSVLVIAAIDGAALFNVLEKAHAANVSIISYDRLIVNSPWVSYYATFDNFKVGVLQGGYIVKALGLDKGKKGPFNVELFAGSPDDTNAGYFFNGAMSQLGPFIKSGVLVVKSGQTDFAKVATLSWDGAVAQKRMDDILTSKYTDARVDAVLSQIGRASCRERVFVHV